MVKPDPQIYIDFKEAADLLGCTLHTFYNFFSPRIPKESKHRFRKRLYLKRSEFQQLFGQRVTL